MTLGSGREPLVERAQARDLAELSRIALECGLSVDFARELERAYSVLLLARDAGGSVCGFLLAWRAADELHLTDLGVAEAFRRRGAARTLVLALRREGERSAASVILLEVRASNAAALGLYRSLGFAEQGTRERYYADNDEDAVVMRLELG